MKNYFTFLLVICFFNYASSQLIPTESFDNDIVVHGSSAPGTVWFAPDYYSPIDFYSTGGCPDGHVEYSGNWNNYWMNFLRTPEVDCSGIDTVILYFNMSNSYDASHTNNKVYFNMWIEGAYHDAAINQTIYFDQLRNCEYIEVVYDLTPYTNKTGVYFYLNALSSYNDSHTFQIKFDNIGLKALTTDTLCNPFAGNDTIICGDCFTTLTAQIANISHSATWSVVSTPSGNNNYSIACPQCPVTDICVFEYGHYVFVLEESGAGCIAYDTINVEFLENPVIQLGNDTVVCKGDIFNLSGNSSGFNGYWLCNYNNILIIDSLDINSDVIIDTTGYFNFIWHEENSMCENSDTLLVESVICSDITDNDINKDFDVFVEDSRINVKLNNFENEKALLNIFSMDGQKVYNCYFRDYCELPEMNDGVYIIEIIFKNNRYYKKIFTKKQ